MGLIARVEALIERLRHEDATLNREKWTEAVDHLEEFLHEIASRVEALENRFHGPESPPAPAPTQPLVATAGNAATAAKADPKAADPAK